MDNNLYYVSQIPRKYIINFPVFSLEDLRFVTNRPNTWGIIKIYIIKINYQNNQRKILGIFLNRFSVNIILPVYGMAIKEKDFSYFKGIISYKNGFYIYFPLIVKPSDQAISINPIYSSKSSIHSQKKKLAQHALDSLEDHRYPEWLPHDILHQVGYLTFTDSLRFLHDPVINVQENPIEAVQKATMGIKKSINRLFLEELVYYYNQQQSLRGNNNCYNHNPGENFHHFIEKWTLTHSQQDCLNEIITDMSKSKRMFRLLYGEVGSGKTILAIAASLIAIDSGFQAVIIVPTHILARQVYQKFLEYTNNKIITILCVGPNKIKEIPLSNGRMIIGTSAACNLKYEKLGLIVFDEQHRFGVKQRMILAQQERAHILFMSATPIPRTLFMVNHKFMDVSYLDGNRSNIKSYLYPVEKIDNLLMKFLPVLRTTKAFWVCSTVHNYQGKYGAMERWEYIKNFMIQNNMEPIDNLFLLHGQQDEKIQQDVISNFSKVPGGLLVATSIIEVGINIPDASIMIVENAESFGIAQLHQLRGRIGRAGQTGKCVFLFKNTGTRLEFITLNTSGMSLSDFDMKNRGTGSIQGFQQQGKAKWKFFSPCKEIIDLSEKIYKSKYQQPQAIKEFFEIINGNQKETLIS